MAESTSPIVVEQFFNVAREQVRSAITERDQMVQWFFDAIPEFRPETGFETRFNVNAGERDFMHHWKITDVVPGEKIVYDWRYEDLPGAGKVTFELLQQGDGTRLRLTNEGLVSFPDLPEFTAESCLGGWKYFLQGNLKSYLESDDN